MKTQLDSNCINKVCLRVIQV